MAKRAMRCRSRSASMSGRGGRPVPFVERTVLEVIRAELRPAVAAADVLDGDVLGDGIQRKPERADLLAADRPVGLVLMPRRSLAGARLLHQELVVEEIHPARAHDPSRDLGGRRLESEAAELREAARRAPGRRRIGPRPANGCTPPREDPARPSPPRPPPREREPLVAERRPSGRQPLAIVGFSLLRW